jgi:hypothetical protein
LNCAFSEFSLDVHLWWMSNLKLIFILFVLISVSATRIVPGTQLMLSSKPYITTLLRSMTTNLGKCAMRQFDWCRKCCSGIFIAADYRLSYIHSCTGWVFCIVDVAIVQSWSPTPLSPR